MATFSNNFKKTVPYTADKQRVSFYTSSDTIYCPGSATLTDYVQSLVDVAADKISNSSTLRGNSFGGLDTAYTVVNKNGNNEEYVKRIAESLWYANSPSVSIEYPYLWKRLRNIIVDASGNKTYSSYTYEFVGSLGEPGIDGNTKEYIFMCRPTALSQDELSPNYGGTGINYTMKGIKSYDANSGEYIYDPANYATLGDYVPTGWDDDPKGVTEENRYQYMAYRKKVNGKWGDFSVPMLWNFLAQDGEQGLAATGIVLDLDNENDYLPFKNVIIDSKTNSSTYSYVTTYNPSTKIFVYYQGKLLETSDFTLKVLDSDDNELKEDSGKYTGSGTTFKLEKQTEYYNLTVTNASYLNKPHVLKFEVTYSPNNGLSDMEAQTSTKVFTLAESLPGTDGTSSFYRLSLSTTGFTASKNGTNTYPETFTVKAQKVTNGEITEVTLSNNLYIKCYTSIIDELSGKNAEELLAFVQSEKLNVNIADYPKDPSTTGSVDNVDISAYRKAICIAKYGSDTPGEEFYKTYYSYDSDGALTFDSEFVTNILYYTRFELYELKDKEEKCWDAETLHKTRDGSSPLDLIFEGNSSTCLSIDSDGNYEPSSIKPVTFTFGIYSAGALVDPTTFTDNKVSGSDAKNEGIFYYVGTSDITENVVQTEDEEKKLITVTIDKNTVIDKFLSDDTKFLNNTIKIKAVCMTDSATTLSVVDVYNITKAISGKPGDDLYNISLDNTQAFIDDESSSKVIENTTKCTATLYKGTEAVAADKWTLKATFNDFLDLTGKSVDNPLKLESSGNTFYAIRSSNSKTITQGSSSIKCTAMVDGTTVSTKVMPIYVKDITKGGKSYKLVANPSVIGYNRDADNATYTNTTSIQLVVSSYQGEDIKIVPDSELLYYHENDSIPSTTLKAGQLYIQGNLNEYSNNEQITNHSYSSSATFGTSASNPITYDAEGYSFNLYIKSEDGEIILLDSQTVTCNAPGLTGATGATAYTITCDNDRIVLDNDTLDATSIEAASKCTFTFYKGNEEITSGVTYECGKIPDEINDLKPKFTENKFYLTLSNPKSTPWTQGYYQIPITATYKGGTFTKNIVIYISDFSAGETYNIVTTPNTLVYAKDSSGTNSRISSNNYKPKAFVNIIGGDDSLLTCKISANSSDPREDGKYSLILSKSNESGYSVSGTGFIKLTGTSNGYYPYNSLDYNQYGYDYMLFYGTNDTPLDIEHISCVSNGTDGASFEYAVSQSNPIIILNKNSSSETVKTAAEQSYTVRNSKGEDITNSCLFRLKKFQFTKKGTSTIDSAYSELELYNYTLTEAIELWPQGEYSLQDAISFKSNGSTLTEGSGMYQIDIICNGIAVNTVTTQFSVVAMGDGVSSYKVVCTDGFYSSTTNGTGPKTVPTVKVLKITGTSSTTEKFTYVTSNNSSSTQDNFYIKITKTGESDLVNDNSHKLDNNILTLNGLGYASTGYDVNLYYGTSSTILDGGRINCNYDPNAIKVQSDKGTFKLLLQSDQSKSTATFDYECSFGEKTPDTIEFTFNNIREQGSLTLKSASIKQQYQVKFTGTPILATYTVTDEESTKDNTIYCSGINIENISEVEKVIWANCASVDVVYKENNTTIYKDTVLRTGFDGYSVGHDENGNYSIYSTGDKISSIAQTADKYSSQFTAQESGNLIKDPIFSDSTLWTGTVENYSTNSDAFLKSLGNVLIPNNSTSVPIRNTLDSSKYYTLSIITQGPLTITGITAETSKYYKYAEISNGGAYYNEDVWSSLADSTQCTEGNWYKTVVTFKVGSSISIQAAKLARPMLNTGKYPIAWTQYGGPVGSQIEQTAESIKLIVKNTTGVTEDALKNAGIYLGSDGKTLLTGEVQATQYNFVDSTSGPTQGTDGFPRYTSLAGFVTKSGLLESQQELIGQGTMTQSKYQIMQTELNSYEDSDILWVQYAKSGDTAGKEVTKYAAMSALGEVTTNIILGYIIYYTPNDNFKYDSTNPYIYEPYIATPGIYYLYGIQQGVFVYDKTSNTCYFTKSAVAGAPRIQGNANNQIILLGFSAYEYHLYGDLESGNGCPWYTDLADPLDVLTRLFYNNTHLQLEVPTDQSKISEKFYNSQIEADLYLLSSIGGFQGYIVKNVNADNWEFGEFCQVNRTDELLLMDTSIDGYTETTSHYVNSKYAVIGRSSSYKEQIETLKSTTINFFKYLQESTNSKISLDQVGLFAMPSNFNFSENKIADNHCAYELEDTSDYWRFIWSPTWAVGVVDVEESQGSYFRISKKDYSIECSNDDNTYTEYNQNNDDSAFQIVQEYIKQIKNKTIAKVSKILRMDPIRYEAGVFSSKVTDSTGSSTPYYAYSDPCNSYPYSNNTTTNYSRDKILSIDLNNGYLEQSYVNSILCVNEFYHCEELTNSKLYNSVAQQLTTFTTGNPLCSQYVQKLRDVQVFQDNSYKPIEFINPNQLCEVSNWQDGETYISNYTDGKSLNENFVKLYNQSKKIPEDTGSWHMHWFSNILCFSFRKNEKYFYFIPYIKSEKFTDSGYEGCSYITNEPLTVYTPDIGCKFGEDAQSGLESTPTIDYCYLPKPN